MMPPLSNWFAVRCADLAQRKHLLDLLHEDGRFDEVAELGSWITAGARFPRTVEDTAEVRRAGLFFIEGRDDALRYGSAEQLGNLAHEYPEALGRVPGDFSFLALRADGTGAAVRACAGLAPLYHAERPGYVAVGTQLVYFLRFLPEAPPVDLFTLSVWACAHMVFPDRRTSLAGVFSVPRGSFLRIRGRHCSLGRYWDPRPASLNPPDAQTRAEHVARLRELLRHHVERDLRFAMYPVVALSGGLDSLSLACVAVRELKLSITALSVLGPPSPNRERELSYMREVTTASELIRHHQVVVGPEELGGLAALTPPSLFPVLHPILGAVRQLHHQRPVDVLLSGDFADQVCGSILSIADWTEQVSLGPVLRSAERALGRKDTLRWLKHRGLRSLGRRFYPFEYSPPPFLHERWKRQYAAWILEQKLRHASDIRPRPILAAHAGAQAWIDMSWELLGPLGIRRSLPFWSRAMLELGFACHATELFGPGTKKILREAVRGLVPERILRRTGKSRRTLVHPAGLSCQVAVPPELVPLFAPGWLDLGARQLTYLEYTTLSRILGLAAAYRSERDARSGSW